jgi:hypothetical protein
LHITDTAHLTERLCTTPELFNNVLNGLETLIQTPDGSSSEDNLTGIAHLAQLHTEEPTPPELPKTREPESTSIQSRTGNHQPSSGKTRSEELHITDTAHLTERLCTTPELLRSVPNG